MSIKKEYIEFCNQCEPCLFLNPTWLDMLDANWQVLKTANLKHQVYFVFVYEKKLGFRFIRNSFLTPYAGFHGEFNEMQDLELQTCIISILQQLPKYDILNIDLHHSIQCKMPKINIAISQKRTNVLTLTSIEENYKQLKPALQRQIKKCDRNLQITEGTNIINLALLYQKTLSKQDEKSAIPIAFFEKVWVHCQTNDCGKLYYISDNENNLHAGILITYDKDTTYYLCGGTDEQFYGSGAMSGLMWHAIQHSITMKKQYFDFEGSMLEGVNKFFQNFSPEEKNYFNLQKTNSTIFKLLNKK